MPQPVPRCSAEGCRYREVPGQGVCVRHGGVKIDPPRHGPAPIDHMPRLCAAVRRDGGSCRQPPIRGAARCRLHGGNAPHVRRKAAERIAETRAVELTHRHSLPRTISAVDALQEELDRTQGRIDWLQREVDLQPNDPGLLSVYTAERNHLRQLAAGMVSAKTDERRQILNERTIETLEAAVTATLRDFGLDPSREAVRQTFGRQLAQRTGHGRSTADPVEAAVVPDYRALQSVDF